MAILSQLQARAVVVSSVVLSLATIFGCYAIAVHLGHVPAWLPMISDCAVESPEKYPFRIGMISSSVLIAFNSYLVWAISGKGVSHYNNIAFGSAVIASLGLATVGAVNEKEASSVHGTAAVIFFVMYELYMVLVTVKLSYISGFANTRKVKSASLWIKIITTCITTVALSLFIYMSSNWGKYGLYIAICEWTGTMCIQAFNLSFVLEYGPNYKVDAVLPSDELLYIVPDSTNAATVVKAANVGKIAGCCAANPKAVMSLDHVHWKAAPIV